MTIHGIPVLALTVVDRCHSDGELGDENVSVLAVVRRPETNSSHPNVVSVPTQRIPQALAELILTKTTEARRGNNPLVYAVDSLFCRKLGLADALERDRIKYHATFGTMKTGISKASSDSGDGVEPTTISMLNLLVRLDKGMELIPAETGSYSRIVWVKRDAFLKGARNKDVSEIDDSFDLLEFCVHGLCVETACSILASMDQ